MIDVVLVDDAPEILVGLKRLIEHLPLACAVSRTFINGYAAVASCMEEPPDILITDIRMPGMSGLELAGKLGECMNRTVIIVLSAYDEFGYVQSAMTKGIFRYLLKPVSTENMQTTLSEAIEELRKRDGNEQVKVDRDTFLAYYCIYELIHDVPLRCPIQACPELTENGVPAPYRLAIVKRVPEQEKFFEDTDFPRMFSLHFLGHEIAIILGDSQAFSTFARIFEARLHAAGCRGAITPKFESIQHLHRDSKSTIAFFDTKMLVSTAAFQQIPVDWYNQRLPFQNEEWEHFLKLLENVKRDFATEDYSACTLHLNETVSALAALKQFLPADEIRSGYLQTIERIESERRASYGLTEHENALLRQAMDDAGRAESVTAICETIRTLFIALSDPVSARKGSSTRIVNMAKTYIALNYSRHITTADIANAVFVSQSYLGTLFRQKTGVRLWNYVTSVRMDAAYKALKETDLPVNQIAETVGFSNINTFYYAFKKTYGFAPGKFRQQADESK